MTNSEHIELFMQAWEARDMDAIMAAFAPDAVYHNIPMPPLKGHQAIDGFIRPFLAQAKRVRFEVHHAAENADGTVLNERTDTFVLETRTLCVRVMGVFQLEAGLITHWRDYFDMAEFTRQTA